MTIAKNSAVTINNEITLDIQGQFTSEISQARVTLGTIGNPPLSNLVIPISTASIIGSYADGNANLLILSNGNVMLDCFGKTVKEFFVAVKYIY